MPAYLDKPTAKHIQTFGKRMEKNGGNQKKLDDAMISLITMSDRPITTTRNPDGTASTATMKQSGFGYGIWRENAQLLKIQLKFKIPVGDDQPHLRDHVDNSLEPFLEARLHQSTKQHDWWSLMTDDFAAIGRAWMWSAYDAGEWAGDEMAAITKQMDETDDADKLTSYRDDLDRLKRKKSPLRDRYVDPRNTHSIFDTKHRLPQVVECKELTKEEYEDEYGDAPKEYVNPTDKIKVYHYANHRWCAAVCTTKEGGEFIEEPWEHGLDRNPYICLEADLLPSGNSKGWRWAGLLFHAEDLINQLDQLITDWCKNIHEWTESPVIIKIDKDATDDADIKEGGRPPEVPYGPGQIVRLWNTEDVTRGPIMEVNQQSIFLSGLLREIIAQTAMVPAAERGEIKSGTSNNAYSSQIQAAQRRSQGRLLGIARFAETWAGNVLKSVCAVTEGYDEKIAVFNMGAKKRIELGYKDAEGWDESVTAIVGQPIEIDEYTRWLIGEKKVNTFGFSPEQIVEEMGYANPEAVTKRGYLWKMRNATIDQDIQAMLALSGQQFAQLGASQKSALQEMLMGASPQVQQAVLEAAQMQGANSANPSPNGQAESNLLRSQVPQAPQNPMTPVMP